MTIYEHIAIHRWRAENKRAWLLTSVAAGAVGALVALAYVVALR